MLSKDLIKRLVPEAEFAPPVEPGAIAGAEERLGTELPDELRDLLLKTNGVKGKWGEGLIWPLERIVEDNLQFRNSPDFAELYMPFAPLLFFADSGGGNQFAYRVLQGKIAGSDIYLWAHENDSRSWCAPTLETYVEWLASGRLEI